MQRATIACTQDGDGGEPTALEQHAETKLDVLAEIRHGPLLFAGLDDGKAQESGEPKAIQVNSAWLSVRYNAEYEK